MTKSLATVLQDISNLRLKIMNLKRQKTILKRQLKHADKYRLTHKEWSKKYED